jgi:hypothetical protein
MAKPWAIFRTYGKAMGYFPYPWQSHGLFSVPMAKPWAIFRTFRAPKIMSEAYVFRQAQ